MKDGNTLVDYTSNEGERIKVTSEFKEVKLTDVVGHRTPSQIYKLEVYVNGRRLAQYLDSDGVGPRTLPLINPELEELARNNASADVVTTTIERILAQHAEYEEIKVDDPTRFLNWE